MQSRRSYAVMRGFWKRDLSAERAVVLASASLNAGRRFRPFSTV
jgi:hypothetical protein